MTGPQGDEARALVREYLERQRMAFTVVEDPKSSTAPVTVIETLSGKALSFSFGQIAAAEEARHPETRSRYVRVHLDDGRNFALTGMGFVFAPVLTATGPLAECPATASFADYEKLSGHLSHLVEDHHEGHEREALQVLMVLLAFVDGARAIGLEVSEEERALEQVLRRLEGMGS